MLTLITLLLFGILAAFFATQNTILVTINLGGYLLTRVPLYVLVFSSMLLGVILASGISLINGISATFDLHQRNQAVQDANRKASHLEDKVHALEVENAKLQEKEHLTEVNTPHQPSIFTKIKRSLA